MILSWFKREADRLIFTNHMLMSLDGMMIVLGIEVTRFEYICVCFKNKRLFLKFVGGVLL